MATEQQLRDYLKRATAELGDARRKLAELASARPEPVAIIGMACRYPGGETVEDFWDLLAAGRGAVTEVPPARWNAGDHYDPERSTPGAVYTKSGAFLSDIAGWDAEFFGVPPAEAMRMDPNQRLLMELVWEGLENAGIAPARAAGTRTAVFAGLMDSLQYGRLETDRHGMGVVTDPYFGQGISTSVVAGRLAYHYGLRGAAVTLDTACSSSLVGLHLAAQALRAGECDLAIAAGAYLIMQPDTYVQGCVTSMLTPDDRIKTFDRGADGYVMGEGGGLVVLEPLSAAIRNGRRIRAVLRGSAVNSDGRSNGLTAPSRGAQVEVIRQALAAAQVDPADVDYVEAHGSGTALGDAIELSALHDVFRARPPGRPLHVGAVKTNIGHTQSAAGMAGLIKTVLALEHGEAPATLNLSEPSDAIPADGTIVPAVTPVTLTAEGRRPIAGVSSFGWSGTNAHLIVEAAPPPAPKASARANANDTHEADPITTLPVSAASPAALEQQLRRLAGWLDTHPDTPLADVAHTLAAGRAELDYRYALDVTSPGDAIRQLTAAANDAARAPRASHRPRVVFLLPGIGDHYPALGRELYRDEPVYAAAVDECLAILERRCQVSLRARFFPPADSQPADTHLASTQPGDDQPAPSAFAAAVRAARAGTVTDQADDPLEAAELAHPFQFTVEYALARLLAHWGVTPDLLVGYSLGEYVAACLAGVFTLDDALYIVTERARLIASVPAGRMLAVATGEEAARALIDAGDHDVDIAALNGPAMTVLSGPPDAIEAVAARLRAAEIAVRPLRTEHAFHSRLLEPVRDKLADVIASVPRHAPLIGVVSNHSSAVLTADEATSSDYWAEHLVRPVRFAHSVAYCLADGADLFIELGAGQTLGSLVRQNQAAATAAAGTGRPARPPVVLGTLPSSWADRAPGDDRAALLSARSRLWEAGVAVDWTAAQGGAGAIVTLPGYPFQRTRFWPEGTSPVTAKTNAATTATTGTAAPEPAGLAYTASWHRDLTAAPAGPAETSGPLVIFADQDGIGAALADQAAAAGTPVLEVIAGPPGTEPDRQGRRIVIDPADPAAYRAVFAAAEPAESETLRIAHLWSQLPAVPDPGTAQPGPGTAPALRATLESGFGSLLFAAQALGDRGTPTPVRLLTVSRGAAEILGGDLTAPAQAAVHGLGRVAQHELAALDWRGADLDTETGPAQAARALLAELARPRDEYPTVAGWRRGRRWAQDWAPVPVPDAPPSPWRPDGVYLITGGTRGLGLALARHLVRAGVRRLALVSRTALGEGQHSQDERTVASRTAVTELRDAGAEVLLLTADTGQPDQLRAALRACREHYGALHGVVHAAGVPADGMIARRTLPDALAVLAPKVMAMDPLAELVGPDTPAGQRPELLVLYSSAITAFGGIGEGDYCAANTVLDAYGAALAATAPATRVLTVAWGPWQHDDWQAAAMAGTGAIGDGLAGRVRAHRQKWGFADDAGCAYLDRLLAAGPGSLLAVRQPMDDSLREWSAILDIGDLVSGVAATPAAERFPRPRLRTEYVAPRTEPERLIAEIWGSFLGIEAVGVHDPFFELGGNSLVGLAVVRAAETELGITIPPATLFGHPTVAEFATATASPEASADTVLDLLNTSADRGRRRRGTRPGKRR